MKNLHSVWFRALALACLLLSLTFTAPAQVIAPGVELKTFVLSGPVRAYVVQVERDRPEYEIRMGFPQGQRNYTSRETLSTITGRYQANPDFDVIASINASFFGGAKDIHGPVGGGGNFIEYPDLSRRWEVTGIGDDLGLIVANGVGIARNWLVYPDGGTQGIDLINQDRQANTLVLYTPDWGPSTQSTLQAVEVIATGANFPLRPNKRVEATVTAIRTGSQSVNNPIPRDGFVLAARDAKAQELVQKLNVGDRVGLQIDLTTSRFNAMRSMVLGAGWILRDGQPERSSWDRFSASFKGKHPRTMVASNDTHFFFIAVDGRQPGVSTGMTFEEMAGFALNILRATDAVNLDGGGSTMLWADGSIRNSPSGGSERAIGNALLLTRNLTRTTSELTDTFAGGERQLPWDDKFTMNHVREFSPPAPGGNGFVMEVMDPVGGVETTKVGARADMNVLVEAYIYCEPRPDVAGQGFERYGLFARDQGNARFTSTTFAGGNCYAMTFESHTGHIRAGKVAGGVYTDMLEEPVQLDVAGWHRFRIICNEDTILWHLDDELILEAQDDTFSHGYSGLGYHETFSDKSLMHGARVDRFRLVPYEPAAWQVR